MSLDEIATRIATQDNHCTADVYFIVEEKVRLYGFDTSWGGDEIWINEEGYEADESELDLLRQEDDGEAEIRGYRRTGYMDQWLFRQAFLTEAGAKDFANTQAHRYVGVLRVYAVSAHRNPEIRAVREHLLFVTTTSKRE